MAIMTSDWLRGCVLQEKYDISVGSYYYNDEHAACRQTGRVTDNLLITDAVNFESWDARIFYPIVC